MSVLQVLLSYCNSFAQDNDVKYNTRKTECMFVRPQECKSDFVPCLNLSGFELKCVMTGVSDNRVETCRVEAA